MNQARVPRSRFIRTWMKGLELATVRHGDLTVPRPETRVDNNDHKSNEDSRVCAAVCFRSGFQPGQRGVRSRGYSRSTHDLLIGRIAESLNMGRLRWSLAPALLHLER